MTTNLYANSNSTPSANAELNSINPSRFIDIDFIAFENKWNINYAKQVQYEYERFLTLRIEDADLSPSDDIDRF